jgi:predicted HTH domain antitoxin
MNIYTIRNILQITEDRRKRVIDLYFNQNKTYAEIAQIEKMSPRDIHAIVKEEESRRQNYQRQQQQEETSSKAYKLFSEGKGPVEVAIALSLREPEATNLFIEYCKLKRLPKFYLAYKELGDNNIGYFVKLCKLAKKEGVNVEQLVKLLQLADEDNDIGLSSFEKWRKWRIDEIRGLDMQIERSKNHLQSVNDEIAGAKYSLDYCRDAYERIRQELQRLYEEKNKLESLLRENNGNIAE